MTVYAITDTKKGTTGIAPTYLQTTQIIKLPPERSASAAFTRWQCPSVCPSVSSSVACNATRRPVAYHVDPPALVESVAPRTLCRGREHCRPRPISSSSSSSFICSVKWKNTVE